MAAMPSVADTARQKLIATDRKLSFAERVELAFRCLDSDLELYARSGSLTREHALKDFRRSRQAGRRASRCLAEK